MWRIVSLEKTLILGKMEGKKDGAGSVWDGHEFEQTVGRSGG